MASFKEKLLSFCKSKKKSKEEKKAKIKDRLHEDAIDVTYDQELDKYMRRFYPSDHCGMEEEDFFNF